MLNDDLWVLVLTNQYLYQNLPTNKQKTYIESEMKKISKRYLQNNNYNNA